MIAGEANEGKKAGGRAKANVIGVVGVDEVNGWA